MNYFIGIGNLTSEPEIRTTTTGKQCANFSIAINTNKTVDFVNCVAWDSVSTIIGKYVCKGSKIAVEGALKNDTYEKDGRKIKKSYILVRQIKLLDKKNTELDNDLPTDNLDMPF